MHVRVLALVVLASAACTSADATISEHVRQRLAAEQTAPPHEQIQISTSGRIVRLEGVVLTNGERDRLERLARETQGVIAVDNRLVLQKPTTVTKGPAPQ